MKSGKEIFKSFFNDETLIEKLDIFYELHKNAKINLTAIKDYDEFYIKHYLDSLYIFKINKFSFDTLMDIGSGGGFPGIPIALLYPEKKIYLVESISKKINFLKEAIGVLKIKNVELINDRCENLKGINNDMIAARGVASVNKILKWTKNVSRETRYFVLYKGGKVFDEIKEARPLIKKMGLEIKNVRVEDPFKRSYIILYRNFN